MSHIIVESNPSHEQLEKLNVKSWPIWEKEISVFPWTYDSTEQCYILEGEVTISTSGGESVVIKAGDFVTLPKGLSCQWDIRKNIRKHYNFI